MRSADLVRDSPIRCSAFSPVSLKPPTARSVSLHKKMCTSTVTHRLTDANGRVPRYFILVESDRLVEVENLSCARTWRVTKRAVQRVFHCNCFIRPLSLAIHLMFTMLSSTT